LSLDAAAGAAGFPQDDNQSELIEDAPLGKLMGVIVEMPSKPARKGKLQASGREKEPEPFEVGADRVIRPRHTSYLYLKVNLPAQSNPSGSLQVQLSGYVLAPDGQNVGK